MADVQRTKRKTTPFTIAFPSQDLAALRSLREREGIPVTVSVRRAVAEYLKHRASSPVAVNP